MSWGEGLIRLSGWQPVAGGQGQPYGDDVVAQVRAMVEGTLLTQKQIAARVGVSQMSVSRWARAGGWRRPVGTSKPFDETGSSLRAMERYNARTKPWRRLEEAEALLARAEGGALDTAERALALLLEARALQAEGVGPRRSRQLSSTRAGSGRRADPPVLLG